MEGAPRGVEREEIESEREGGVREKRARAREREGSGLEVRLHSLEQILLWEVVGARTSDG